LGLHKKFKAIFLPANCLKQKPTSHQKKL